MSEIISVNGIEGSIKDVCEKLGLVRYTTAIMRIRRGWDVIRALTEPAQEQNAVERGNKICSCCKERKPVEDFYVLGRRSGTELMPYCKICASDKTKNDWQEIRIKVLDAYSDGVIKCAHCDEDRIDVLDLDHINGGGCKDRAEFKTSRRLFQNLIKNDFPEGYRVLCRNCNWMAYIELKDKENE